MKQMKKVLIFSMVFFMGIVFMSKYASETVSANSDDAVKKRYANVTLTNEKTVNDAYENLEENESLVYKFTVNKKADVLLKFLSGTSGSLVYKIYDEDKNIYLEKDNFFYKDKKSHVVELGKGTYWLEISPSYVSANIEFELCLANRVVKQTIVGNGKHYEYPGLGQGTWKTSDETVVKLAKTQGASCYFIPQKPGKATVTFVGKMGKMKYNITVKKDLKIIEQTITSCEMFLAESGQGIGEWTTKQTDIVQFSNKKAAKKYIRGKNAGKATVMFRNPLATYKYIITVKVGKTYPFEDAYFTMDSAGGVEPAVLISNNSDKTIKYVNFRAYFYNRVNDPVDYYGSNYSDQRIIGPLKPWNFSWYYWTPVLYDDTAVTMRVKTAKITYMDGSTKTVKVNRNFKLRDE